MKVGDFVKLHTYEDPEEHIDDAVVLDLVEHDGIIIKVDNMRASELQILWSDGDIEWMTANDVQIIPNPDIS